MKLIIGIGNPGEKYEKTRHNVGFLVLDEIKNEISKSETRNSKQIPNPNFELSKKFKSEIFQADDLILAKPQTFMNNSGIAVVKIANFYHLVPSALFVVHDDLDIKLGEYKLQKGKGPRDHNGLVSIYEKLGTKDFWHARVGIENRGEINTNKYKFSINTNFQIGTKISGQEYVLQKFSGEELAILDKTILAVSEELLSKIAA